MWLAPKVLPGFLSWRPFFTVWHIPDTTTLIPIWNDDFRLLSYTSIPSSSG